MRYKILFLTLIAFCVFTAQSLHSAEPENPRCAKFKDLINEATNGNYDAVKKFEPEIALTLWVFRLQRLGYPLEALNLLRNIIVAQARAFGANDLRVACNLKIAGDLAFESGSVGYACDCYERSIIIQRRTLNNDDPYRIWTLAEFATQLVKSPLPLTNHRFYLFQLQGILLRRKYPGSSEVAAAQRCNAEKMYIAKLPIGQWIEHFDPRHFTVLEWQKVTKPSDGKGQLRRILKETLEDYAALLALTFDESANHSIECPTYINPITGLLEQPVLQKAETGTQALAKLTPGQINCRVVLKNKELAGFVLSVAGSSTETVWKNEGDVVLEEKLDVTTYNKFQHLRKLCVEFSKLDRSALARDFPFQIYLGQKDIPLSRQLINYFGRSLRNRVRVAWHPLGFSYRQPIKIGFYLDANGRVTNKRVLNSSGNKDIDQCALDTVEKTYPPFPKALSARLPVEFRFGSLATGDWIQTDKAAFVRKLEVETANRLALLQKQIVELEYGKQ